MSFGAPKREREGEADDWAMDPLVRRRWLAEGRWLAEPLYEANAFFFNNSIAASQSQGMPWEVYWAHLKLSLLFLEFKFVPHGRFLYYSPPEPQYRQASEYRREIIAEFDRLYGTTRPLHMDPSWAYNSAELGRETDRLARLISPKARAAFEAADWVGARIIATALHVMPFASMARPLEFKDEVIVFAYPTWANLAVKDAVHLGAALGLDDASLLANTFTMFPLDVEAWISAHPSRVALASSTMDFYIPPPT
jgi:hypothetical protein